MLISAFPWAHSIRRILDADRPNPFAGSHLFLGSDYGGDHRGSSYKTYAYLVVNDAPTRWLAMQREIRSEYLKDGRRMSFKRLGDPQRQAALVPFLQAADALDGHLVVFVLHKALRLHPIQKGNFKYWRESLHLSAKWNARAFEVAFLKLHLFSLLLAQWAKPNVDVTWISDQDEFIANNNRLHDIHQLAARMSSIYLQHPMGIFTMNTTEIDGGGREFEDLVAVSDLAAGMMAELTSALATGATWSDMKRLKVLQEVVLQPKSELLLDWFWYPNAKLKRTCIVLDKDTPRSRVFRLDRLS